MSGLYMVFDVESVGLHGEGFAVAWCLVDSSGATLAEGCHFCDPAEAKGDDEGRAWIGENVPRPQAGDECEDPREVRDEFWRAWVHAKEQGAALAADCAWPVEARFLAACVDDDPEARKWGGPYPLVEISSARLAAGLDPFGTEERLENELPLHDPLADARQSARLLLEALGRARV